MALRHPPLRSRLRFAASALVVAGAGVSYAALASHPDPTFPVMSTALLGATVVATVLAGYVTYVAYPAFSQRVGAAYVRVVVLAALTLLWNVYVALAIT
ncbi:hypothetical protein [Halomicrococcus sp. NG-SE-24]|uniref:hypothetical protein n=1 Tax=Halomicrococcus sp. NG-SE-24 TaxID=3436928 RepID=UPI003D991EEC